MNKTELGRHLWSVLQSGKISPEVEALLHDLIKKHPKAAEKIGCGIDHFEIRKNPEFNQNKFYIVRTDGSVTGFGYRKCLNGPPSLRDEVIHGAMRREVAPDIIHYARYGLEYSCSITGASLVPGQIHVDHNPPFIEIATDFLIRIGIEAIKLKDGKMDPEQARRWREDHSARAKLSLTTAAANMRKGAKETPAPMDTAHIEDGEPLAREQESEEPHE